MLITLIAALIDVYYRITTAVTTIRKRGLSKVAPLIPTTVLSIGSTILLGYTLIQQLPEGSTLL